MVNARAGARVGAETRVGVGALASRVRARGQGQGYLPSREQGVLSDEAGRGRGWVGAWDQGGVWGSGGGCGAREEVPGCAPGTAERRSGCGARCRRSHSTTSCASMSGTATRCGEALPSPPPLPSQSVAAAAVRPSDGAQPQKL
eukprot:scaffold17369_cov70-Phaeocystis_antarctica.AAC.1